MWKDPVVEDTRKLREELGREFHDDPNALFAYLQEHQKTSGRRIVSRPPRPPRLQAEVRC